MSNARVGDDRGHLRQTVLETTGPARYVFDRPNPTRAENRRSVTADPRASTQGLPVAMCANTPLVDIDSDLLGLTRRYGKCDSAKYDPRRDSRRCEVRSPISTNAAPPTPLDTEDCRLQNPPCTLRGTGINRFEWLCADPQSTALEPFPTAVDFRSVAKDNHRPLVEEPLAEHATPPRPAAGADTPFGRVEIGKDIAAAVAAYPKLPTMVHWRDADEVKRISGGSCSCTLKRCR